MQKSKRNAKRCLQDPNYESGENGKHSPFSKTTGGNKYLLLMKIADLDG
jgi:hypothetical protein